MALNESQQINEVIEKAKSILITFPKDFTPDAVASSLALYLILKKKDKLVDIVCDGFVLPKNLAFLPKSKLIKSKLSSLQKFVISVDNKENNIEDFSYNLEGEKLKIYITPKSGSINEENFQAENSGYKYDLIIVLDSADLASLGDIYKNNTEFFYDTTILNMDHDPENEHFGQINLTNMNSVATAGVLFRLINTLDINMLDDDIATCMLTGLISKTRSFKTSNVTPATLKLASVLLEANADREKIIKNLYRSRSIGTLNLWGRVLTRLKSDQGSKLIWSTLTDNDFVEAKASQDDLADVIDELISFIPGVELVALFYQLNGKNHVILSTLKTHNALYLTSKFKPQGNKNVAEFIIDEKTLLETEKDVIEEIKKKLG